MRVYISGPMRGLPDLGFPAFRMAAAEVAAYGHDPLDPSTLPSGLTDAQYMDMDLAMIRSADALLVLPGWEDSRGAQVETAYAAFLGLPIYDCVEDLPAVEEVRP